MKRVSIIGSTGSIGRQTLNVIRQHIGDYKIVALACGKNEQLLFEQAKEFAPEYLGVQYPSSAIRATKSSSISKANKSNSVSKANKSSSVSKTIISLDKNETYINGNKVTVFSGEAAAETIARLPNVDIIVISIVGLAALRPVLAAVKTGARVALGNKEALVSGGDLILREAALCGSEIIPIDSEHSALFQCLKCGRTDEVKRLILTASGGAYYSQDFSTLDNISPSEAVRHPTWNMGKKISVDSATMVNKGLELIEAHRLYGIKNLDYVIHPQSIIHSLVEYVDGASIAQLSYPNMELAIQYAITCPARQACKNVTPFDFNKALTFLPKNPTFNAPELALECISEGGTAPALYNMANDFAVNAFLDGQIKFTKITKIIECVLNDFAREYNYDIDRLIELELSVSNYIKDKFI